MSEQRDVFPSKDGDFDDFQRTLFNQCQTNTGNWGIDPTKITNLVPYKLDWETKWVVASDKSNRTPVETRLKDLARAAYELVLRPFIKGLYINPMMNEADIEACGLKPHDTSRTPIPAPDTLPVVETKPLPGHRALITFKQAADENGVSRRGKPKGVAFCEVVYKISDVAPVGPGECPLKLASTRSPHTVEFETQQAGQKIFYYARWVSGRLEPGPWTNVNEFIIP